MNYSDELERYQDEAEDRYDDYDSHPDDEVWEEDEFDTGFEGVEDGYDDEEYEDDYDEEYEDDYDDDYEDVEEVEYLPMGGGGEYESYYDEYSTQSIGRIDPNDRTLTVVVSNTSGTGDKEVVIFGANEGAEPDPGATILVEESSHKEVREESKANPFKIAGMKMSVSNPLQFDNVLKITRRSATGSNTVRVYQPRNATSPQNFSQQLIDDAAFEMDVTGQDAIRMTVKDGTTIVFTFTIKARANMGNLLEGRNVAELSATPRTTGLPQIDLLQGKRPTAFGLKPQKKRRKVVKKVVRRRPSRRQEIRRRRRLSPEMRRRRRARRLRRR